MSLCLRVPEGVSHIYFRPALSPSLFVASFLPFCVFLSPSLSLSVFLYPLALSLSLSGSSSYYLTYLPWAECTLMEHWAFANLTPHYTQRNNCDRYTVHPACLNRNMITPLKPLTRTVIGYGKLSELCLISRCVTTQGESETLLSLALRQGFCVTSSIHPMG